jgi:hypothetical protein
MAVARIGHRPFDLEEWQAGQVPETPPVRGIVGDDRGPHPRLDVAKEGVPGIAVRLEVEVEELRDRCVVLRRFQDSVEQVRHEFCIYSIEPADRLPRSRSGVELAELRSASNW